MSRAIESAVFTAARIGDLELRNRLIRSGCYEGLAREGNVTEELIEHHRRLAAGGIAMTTLGYCAVSFDGRGFTARTPLYMMRGNVPVREMAANQPDLFARLSTRLLGRLFAKFGRATARDPELVCRLRSAGWRRGTCGERAYGVRACAVRSLRRVNALSNAPFRR